MAEGIASVNGIDISYVIHTPGGQEPTHERPWVVLINGLADEKETWIYQIDDFTGAGYTVLAFDNRGIGRTSAPAGPYTASLLAKDTAALTSHLKLSPHHVVGVSMGGMVSQQYAHDFPNKLVSLTLACTYARPGPFCSRMFDMWADTAPVMGVPHVMRDVTLWAFTLDWFQNKPDDVKEVEEAMKNMTMSVPAYLSQLAVIQKFDSTQLLVDLPQVPTLVLAAEHDILIPVALSQELSDMIPHSRWKTVHGGHACMWEVPEDFNKAVIEFLDSVEA